MTQMSSSNKVNRLGSVYRDIMLRYKSVWILYSVLLAVVGPVFLIQDVNRFRQHPEWSGSFYMSTEVVFYFVALALSCILPLLLFSYINNRQAVDVFHAMPVTRNKLYWGHVLAGGTILLAPYLGLGIPCALVSRIMDENSEMGWRLFQILLIMLSLYSTMIFIMVNCGTLFESIVYFGIIEVGFPLMIAAVTVSLGNMTYGWIGTPYEGLPGFFLKFSPWFMMIDALDTGTPDWQLVGQTGALIAAALAGGMILYRKRKSESAGKSFAFRPLFYVGSVMISLVAGIGCYLLFDNLSWVLVLSVLVGTVCYFVLDTIRNRGLSGIRQTGLVSLCVIGAAGVFYGTAMLTGTFGYESRIPHGDQVKSVSVSWSLTGPGENSYLSSEYRITDPENISRVQAAHQGIVRNAEILSKYDDLSPYELKKIGEIPPLGGNYQQYPFDESTGWDYGFSRILVSYQLKSGKTVNRHYRMVPTTLTYPLYQAAASREYQDLQWKKMEDDLKQNRFWDSYSWEMSFVRNDRYLDETLSCREAENLAKAIIADLKARPDEWNVHPKTAPVFSLELYSNEVREGRDYIRYSLNISAGDVNTVNYLKKKGYNVELSADGSLIGEYVPKDQEQTTASAASGQDSYDEVSYDEDRNYYSMTLIPASEMEEEQWRTRRELFHFGGVGLPDMVYEDTAISEHQLEQLLSMANQHYISEEPRDVLVLNNISYLVYPEYQETVREMFRNLP